MGKRFTLFDDLDDTLEADSTVTFSVENIAYEREHRLRTRPVQPEHCQAP